VFTAIMLPDRVRSRLQQGFNWVPLRHGHWQLVDGALWHRHSFGKTTGTMNAYETAVAAEFRPGGDALVTRTAHDQRVYDNSSAIGRLAGKLVPQDEGRPAAARLPDAVEVAPADPGTNHFDNGSRPGLPAVLPPLSSLRAQEQ
jgi:hypothetical protein